MSPGGPNRVREALDVLCNASVDLLRPHRIELLAAVHKLQLLIEGQSTAIVVVTPREASSPSTDDPGRPSPSSVSHQSSTNPPTINTLLPFSLNSKDPLGPSPGQHTSSQAPPQAHLPPPAPPNSTEKFVREIRDRLVKIEKCLSTVYQKGVRSEPVWRDDDPRLVDLQVSGNSNSSPITKFRRGLSQRSLAIEFNDWESKTHRSSILQERASDPSIEPGRKLGHITEFLRANKHRFHNTGVARSGIEHGLKLLVCEALLDGKGYSAILIFRYTTFRRIKYTEYNELKDEIKKSDSIKELAEQKADWLDQCQSIYNTWYESIRLNRLQSRPSAGIKRPRLDCSSSQPKRLKAREPHGDLSDTNQHMNRASLTSGAGVEASASPGRQTQATPGSIPNIAATSPSQQTQSHQYEQSQQSPALRVPSPQNIIPSNLPYYFDDSVSSGGCDGTNTTSTTGVAIGGTAHQSSSHSISASSSQNNPMQGANGFILSQCRQYEGQHKAPSKDGGNPVATVQLFRSAPSNSFPTDIETEQLPGFGTDKELNYTATSTALNVSNDAWQFSQPLDPRPYNDAWQFSQPLDPRPYNDAWQFSQPLDPRPYNDAWQLSQSLDPSLYNDAWSLSRPSEPAPQILLM